MTARFLFAIGMAVASAADGFLAGFAQGWRMQPELIRMRDDLRRRKHLRVVKGGAA